MEREDYLTIVLVMLSWFVIYQLYYANSEPLDFCINHEFSKQKFMDDYGVCPIPEIKVKDTSRCELDDLDLLLLLMF